uniref:Meg domain-containing protein n=1 Tax=Setaria viridis TaxID=4556 RepID=A0A4U6T978_SETVI|nr:hypothetical protein SEVIR_9G520800v2 [Setaria viridis]
MTAILLVILVGTARSHAYSLRKMSNNATATFDESKVKLVFCAKMECDTKPYDCYCCWNERPESLCYDTMRECRAKCPHCDPVCPP